MCKAKKTTSLILIAIISFSTHTFSQNRVIKTNCYDVIDGISHFWIKDSLTNNGYRRSVYRQLLNCNLEKTYARYLLRKLGKPTRIDRYSDSSMYFRYYYYDYKKQDKGFEGPYGFDYIGFQIDPRDSSVIGISHGTGDY